MESFLGFIILNLIFRNRQESFILKKEKESSVMFMRIPFLYKQKKENIDLTFSASRGMSPVHGQYLKNSGALQVSVFLLLLMIIFGAWLPARMWNPNILILKTGYRQEFLQHWLPMPILHLNQK
jgi:hypothetical protein